MSEVGANSSGSGGGDEHSDKDDEGDKEKRGAFCDVMVMGGAGIAGQ